MIDVGPEPIPAKILKPKLKLGPTENQSTSPTPSVVRTQTAARGHNVFRPDIYRVSEGYLN